MDSSGYTLPYLQKDKKSRNLHGYSAYTRAAHLQSYVKAIDCPSQTLYFKRRNRAYNIRSLGLFLPLGTHSLQLCRCYRSVHLPQKARYCGAYMGNARGIFKTLYVREFLLVFKIIHVTSSLPLHMKSFFFFFEFYEFINFPVSYC